MSYTSMLFFVFVLVTVILFYLVPKKIQWVVLLASSMFFYAMSGWKNLIFLMGSITVAYVGARLMESSWKQQEDALKAEGLDKKQKRAIKEQFKKKRKRNLIILLVIELGVLAVVKYTNFMIGNVNGILYLFGERQQISALNIIVPMGISFYTFQMVAYIMDCYKGKVRPQSNFFKYALYVSYFPHVVQGPIARYNQLSDQLFEKKEFRMDRIRDGLLLMMWGLFKKLVIADRLSPFVADVYDNYDLHSGLLLFVTTVMYSIQIYADFSGCMDIVSGVSEMLGVKLSQNFLRPYFSKTIPEFWRRWHATMGSFFKDYVFYPVSVSKASLNLNKNARKIFGANAGRIISSCFPVLIVWMLTGLWHGAAWTYIFWGLFHGILIMLSTIFTDYNKKLSEKIHLNTESWWWKLIQMLRTFFLCTMGRIFFRATDLMAAFRIYGKMFTGVGRYEVFTKRFFEHGIDLPNMVCVAVAMLVLLAASCLQEKMTVREKITALPLPLRWGFYYLAFFIVVIFGVYGPGYDASSFIYEKF